MILSSASKLSILMHIQAYIINSITVTHKNVCIVLLLLVYMMYFRLYFIVYAELALVASTVAIEQVNFVYSSDHLMNFTMANHDEQFNNPFCVRNQIQCVYECFTRPIELAYHYALYKSEHLQCVCKRDFDWRRFVEIAADVNTVLRIEIREGLIVLICEKFCSFFSCLDFLKMHSFLVNLFRSTCSKSLETSVFIGNCSYDMNSK